MKNEREPYFDVARGIVIILVVLGHVTKDKVMRDVIFSFHMPFFVLASGFFFKEGKSFKELLAGWAKKLLIPYFFTQGFIIFYSMIINKTSFGEAIKLFFLRSFLGLSYESKISLTTELGYSGLALNTGVLWFIPFFISVGIMFWAINKFLSSNASRLLAVIIVTVIGIILGKNGYWLVLSLDVACASLIFMYMGYMMRKAEVIERFQKTWKYCIVLFAFWILAMQYSNLELAVRTYTDTFVSYTGAVAGSVVLLILCQKTALKKAKILQWFGKNSMLVLCAHNIEWNLIKYDFVSEQHYMVLFLCKMLIITIIVLAMKIIGNLVKSGRSWVKRSIVAK